MPILDIEKDQLLPLTAGQLEELVARLAEAEVSAKGGKVSDVYWSGSMTAPDDGEDVRVDVSTDDFEGDFVSKPTTVFQVKKPKMPASKIGDEMCPGGVLAKTVSDLAASSGAYIIVSLNDDCSPPVLKDRLKAMSRSVEKDPNSEYLTLDFYDRSKLCQWLRQHITCLFRSHFFFEVSIKTLRTLGLLESFLRLRFKSQYTGFLVE